jgi:hypothetical protein
MSVNEVIEDNKSKTVESKNQKGPVGKVVWSDLVEQNRLGKLYSVAQQISLIAVEWGIEPKDIGEQLIKPLGTLVDSACKELVDSVKE